MTGYPGNTVSMLDYPAHTVSYHILGLLLVLVQCPLIYHACDDENRAAECGLSGIDVTNEDNVDMFLAVHILQSLLVDIGSLLLLDSHRITSGALRAGP